MSVSRGSGFDTESSHLEVGISWSFTKVPFVESRSMMNGLGVRPSMRIRARLLHKTTHLIDIFASPNSFLSVICRNCITACCFEADGWAIGMSETCVTSGHQ